MLILAHIICHGAPLHTATLGHLAMIACASRALIAAVCAVLFSQHQHRRVPLHHELLSVAVRVLRFAEGQQRRLRQPLPPQLLLANPPRLLDYGHVLATLLIRWQVVVGFVIVVGVDVHDPVPEVHARGFAVRSLLGGRHLILCKLLVALHVLVAELSFDLRRAQLRHTVATAVVAGRLDVCEPHLHDRYCHQEEGEGEQPDEDLAKVEAGAEAPIA
mmetsp:Transcript_67215/g.133200  ORF Transcript_67215/g.133200 Transcript_67215/m.133200 type:complete len:217 (+) Transcript_67215:213-863(+)